MNKMEVSAKSIIEDIAKFSEIDGFEYTNHVPDDKNRFIGIYCGIHALAELLGIELED